jgi:hypothetical protein
MNEQTQNERWNQAISIFVESVLKPDYELRMESYHEHCFSELMELRKNVIDHLNTLRR